MMRKLRALELIEISGRAALGLAATALAVLIRLLCVASLAAAGGFCAILLRNAWVELGPFWQFLGKLGEELSSPDGQSFLWGFGLTFVAVLVLWAGPALSWRLRRWRLINR